VFDTPQRHSPLIFSSKFCNYQSLKLSQARKIVDEPPVYHGTHRERITGTYSSEILTTLGSREVMLKVAVDDLGGHLACFKTKKNGQDSCLSFTMDGGILLFDCTATAYANVMRSLFSKKWPNHVLLYDAENRSINWKIGWGEYIFRLRTDTHQSNTSDYVSSISDESMLDWYCAQHGKFSFLRLGTEENSKYLQISYRLAYSFPWSQRSVRFPVIRRGAVYSFNHKTPEVSDILNTVAGQLPVEFVHLVESPDRLKLFLSIASVPTLVFSKC